MSYVVSWNTNNQQHIPKIHLASCLEIRKHKKEEKSKYHKYSDEEFPNFSLSSCEDVKNFKNEKGFTTLECCKTCNPTCCENS